ncbi:MAG: hypothetical protein KL863_07420 [Rhizobium sp.]|nr:hypothetical protein [Rhizobium sp.]
MAIGTLGQLKNAITSWTDQGGALGEEMTDFVRMATDCFNYGTDTIPPLRVREMIAVTSLTPVDGVCTLPADYLQYRRVVQEASIRRELQYITPSASDQHYPDRAGGPACDFTIVGNSLYMFPVGSQDIELTYYQKIPQLTSETGTNWLLTAHPTLYLHAGILQVGFYRRNDELISRSLAVMASYMAGLRSSDQRSEFARAGTRLRAAY